VLLVGYDDRSLLEAKMLHDLELPFPLLLDPERTTYAAWGLGRTNLFERFLGFAPDMFQLGGDFVVDARGIVRFAHRMRDNGDRAPVDRLLEALGAAAADRGAR